MEDAMRQQVAEVMNISRMRNNIQGAFDAYEDIKLRTDRTSKVLIFEMELYLEDPNTLNLRFLDGVYECWKLENK